MKYSEFTVTQLPDDPRLDKVIPLNVTSVSRGAARRRIEAGAVYVNGKRCQQNGRTVRAGDKVRVMEEAEQRPDQQFQEFQFTADRILFEDQDWIVVNKPAALPTHETIDSTRHHLVRSLEQFLAARDKVPVEKVYLGLHHRLDVNTTGIILFTKRKEANAPVAQAFQERTVQKTYLAASLGELKEPALIKSFLGESSINKRKVVSVRGGGKYAETAIRSVETKTIQARRVSLIEASPKPAVRTRFARTSARITCPYLATRCTAFVFRAQNAFCSTRGILKSWGKHSTHHYRKISACWVSRSRRVRATYCPQAHNLSVRVKEGHTPGAHSLEPPSLGRYNRDHEKDIHRDWAFG